MIALLLVYALIHFPAAWKHAVAFERASRAEKGGNFARAEATYVALADAYPDSDEMLVRLAVSSYRAGHGERSKEIVDRLRGRHPSREQIKEINDLLGEAARRRPAAPRAP